MTHYFQKETYIVVYYVIMDSEVDGVGIMECWITKINGQLAKFNKQSSTFEPQYASGQ